MLWANFIVKSTQSYRNSQAPRDPRGKETWRMSVLEDGSWIGWLGRGAGDLTLGLGVARPGPLECSRGPISLDGHQAL